MLGTKSRKQTRTTFEGITSEELRDLLVDIGYKAELEPSKNLLRSAASGAQFTISFYGADAPTERAHSLQFIVAFRLGAGDRNVRRERVNEWNRTKRFLKVFIDQEEDLVGIMDLNVEKGVSRAQLVDDVELFASLLASLVRFDV